MNRQINQDRSFGSRVGLLIVMFLLANCSYFDTAGGPEQSDGGQQQQGECQTTGDCINAHGPAQNGCAWFCMNRQCIQTGDSCGSQDGGVSDDGGNQTDPDDDTNVDPNCLGDLLGVMEEGLCSCECKDCECSGLDCSCDLTCYQNPPPPGCVVNLDPDGNLVIDGAQFENCELECEEESDLTDEMPCTLNNCVTPANNVNIDINPNQQTVVNTAELELEHEIREVDVLFVVDNSGSMEDDQMAAACAVDMFLDSASANGGQFTAGVVNTDLANPTTGLLGIANPNNCEVQVSTCKCGSNGELPPVPSDFEPCNFNQNGDWIVNDPDALKKTIVQGIEWSCGCEGGLQQAFRLFARLEVEGKFEGPYETVVITDEEADGDGDLCPFRASIDQNLKNQLKNSPLGWNPPTPVGTNASCKQDMIDFYTYYFTSRDIMVHGLIFANGCANDSTEEMGEIYKAVIQATSGHESSICDCNAFAPFMQDVGDTTSDMSTQLCVEDQTAAQKILDDLSSVVVHYTEGGVDQVVPYSATDGWTFDAATSCFILSGTWEDKMGTFRIEYKGGPTQVIFEDVEVCPADFDPIPNTVVVTCDVNGQATEVPQSNTNGWSLQTINGQNCLVFTGSWREQALACSLEFRPNP